MAAPATRLILVCEDNDDDIALFERAFAAARITNVVHYVHDGEKAIDYLSGTGDFGDRDRFPLPALVFVDLKMPFLTGFEVVQWMRDHREFDATCIVVLSSSDEPRDVTRAGELGASGYLVKPPRPADLQAVLNLVAHHHGGSWVGMKLADFGIGR